MRALIIDDSRATRRIIGGIFGELGFETFEAGDGQEALDRLVETGPLEVATVDWNMPVMDGLTFIRKVRRIPLHRQMTLIMVTTESEHDQVVRALAAGAHEYIIKPFKKQDVIDRLHLLGLMPEGDGNPA